MKKILILDSDLGFLFWAGQALHRAGHETFPAGNAVEAAALLERLKTSIDLLIAGVETAGAAEIAESIVRSNPSAKVLAVWSEGQARSAPNLQADATRAKPAELEESSAADFVRDVNRILEGGGSAARSRRMI